MAIEQLERLAKMIIKIMNIVQVIISYNYSSTTIGYITLYSFLPMTELQAKDLNLSFILVDLAGSLTRYTVKDTHYFLCI